ncbi:hypothetical protein PG995_012401 [Apiospora arundinis]
MTSETPDIEHIFAWWRRTCDTVPPIHLLTRTTYIRDILLPTAPNSDDLSPTRKGNEAARLLEVLTGGGKRESLGQEERTGTGIRTLRTRKLESLFVRRLPRNTSRNLTRRGAVLLLLLVLVLVLLVLLDGEVG